MPQKTSNTFLKLPLGPSLWVKPNDGLYPSPLAFEDTAPADDPLARLGTSNAPQAMQARNRRFIEADLPGAGFNVTRP
jgi:hypothetical protein